MKSRSQLTLGTGFEKYTKTTRRAQFLAEMDRVVPWRELCARIEPVYPKPFVGIDLGCEPVPDETTVCKFRHLLEQQGLGQVLFDAVRDHLRARGISVSTGTIVDATIIAAPSSTKNATGTRDPGMHQTQKGRQWYFGMKGHFGVDSQSKLIHSVEATSANTHDSHVLPWLLHGDERRVWGDSAYAGQTGLLSVRAPHARDFTQRRATTLEQRATNRWKSRVRARVEHSIGVIKRVFGFTKVRYRGLAKNRHRLVVACALANLFMMRTRLLRLQEA
jgi:IS5 family transposase